MGVFLSLFSDLGFASVVKGSPDPNKVQEGRKTLKNGVQKGHHFHKNSQFFVMFFSLVFGGVLGSVFLRFGGRNVQNGGYLDTLFQVCCSKAGKLKTSVSCTPNTTFPSSEGLGKDIWGNFFHHLF